jgi:hypothetical protein
MRIAALAATPIPWKEIGATNGPPSIREPATKTRGIPRTRKAAHPGGQRHKSRRERYALNPPVPACPHTTARPAMAVPHVARKRAGWLPLISPSRSAATSGQRM